MNFQAVKISKVCFCVLFPQKLLVDRLHKNKEENQKRRQRRQRIRHRERWESPGWWWGDHHEMAWSGGSPDCRSQGSESNFLKTLNQLGREQYGESVGVNYREVPRKTKQTETIIIMWILIQPNYNSIGMMSGVWAVWVFAVCLVIRKS